MLRFLVIRNNKLNLTLILQVIKSVSAGSRHSAAVTSNNELYTWGEGEHGRLGIVTVFQLFSFLFKFLIFYCFN